MKNFKLLIFSIIIVVFHHSYSQEIPTNEILETNKLASFLNEEVISQLQQEKVISNVQLANYFREKFSERYFNNWKNFEKRFKDYNVLYSDQEFNHTERALDHIVKYLDSTQWVLPFNYLNGEPVNAYAIRHLARQHKMVDIAFYYYYQQKNPTYLNYFKNQLQSLNYALHHNKYETIEDGNGVYEAFRSGYRVLNWLQIHNMFLGQKDYSDEDQLITIATLLQHGAHLYKHNQEFVPGNHQTRGMSALAMISILLRDFKGTELWYNHAMKLLGEHLSKEINEDGFQFERSVHYHISDIENYFYVYQLAKNSEIKVDIYWEEKLKSLFTTLVKIAYPDKSAPVLQDDTDIPWAEKNNISGALTLGYLLFDDPIMGYFAAPNVESNIYWYLNERQLEQLSTIVKEKPTFMSVSFPTTGYYIMREGWEPKNKMMIITAGLDNEKPDHQHGDMLGVQAMANGKVILPNYQVRYFLEDLEFFKNSIVKNVALVDEELQGRNYTSNQGGSGFGKFRKLPNPKVIGWSNHKNNDFFVGSHDGFGHIGVAYTRQVININNDFWVVKDNFKSENPHTYKQLWQGHYTLEQQPNLIRATFDDASGFDIYHLRAIDEVSTSGTRGKQWAVQSKKEVTNFSFITVLFPYIGFENRINELDKSPSFKGWKLNTSVWNATGEGLISLTNNNESYFFGVKTLEFKNTHIEFSSITDVYITLENNELNIRSIGENEVGITIKEAKSAKQNIKKNFKIVQLKPGVFYKL